MIEIKAFYGDWKEATEAQAISFYDTFCSGSTALTLTDNPFVNMHNIPMLLKSPLEGQENALMCV